MIAESKTRDKLLKSLSVQAETLGGERIRRLFRDNPDRFDQWSFQSGGLFVDFSKNLIDENALATLLDLARAMDLEDWRRAMFAGDIVNQSEQRTALHVALRHSGGIEPHVAHPEIEEQIAAALDQMERISSRLRNAQWIGAGGDPITDVVHIGIGGSILGPLAAVRALSCDEGTFPRIHFVSNVDASALMTVLNKLNPRTTLINIVSKSFTTPETLTNGMTARQWLASAVPEAALDRHMIAITANQAMAREFGIAPENILTFWDWVGGRFSLWSTVGLPIAIAVGMDSFRRLLNGAAAMDAHFLKTPLNKNLPVLLALIGIWNTNFLNISAHAVLPYDDRLRRLPAHIQQLEMESTGKSVDRHGHPVEQKTAPIVFGMAGTDAQHTFFQAVHQGTHPVSADFIGCLQDDFDDTRHHNQLLANMFAQSEALMVGWSAPDEEGRKEKVCPGNRPSTTILLDSMSPENLGMLFALYEHKVFVQGVVWGINPFDQWGVELGKKLAGDILAELSGSKPSGNHDPSTSALIRRYLDYQRTRS